MEIFVSSRDGTPAKYPPHQVLAMWRRGELKEEMVYWRRGMADWRPLPEFIAEEEGEPDEAAEVEAPRYTFAKEPERSTAHLKLMLWFSAAISLVAAGTQFLFWQDLQQADVTKTVILENQQRMQFVSVMQLVAVVTAKISLLIWIYRAVVNNHGFGAAGLRYRPTWAVWAFILPLVNLVVPYFVLRETYRVSRDPQSWQLQPVTPRLRQWWVTWLFVHFMEVMVSAHQLQLLMKPEDLTVLKQLLPPAMIWNVSLAGYYLLTHMVVTAIYFHQMRLVRGDEAEEDVQPTEG